MKQQYLNKRSWPRAGRLAAVLAAAGLLFAACNDDPATEAQGGPLPAGAYPLSLKAAVTPASSATPATADEAWTGGEQVAVEASSASVPAAVKTYTVAADGSLSPADAADRFWWKSTDEQKTLRAWYCGDGSSAAGGVNAAAPPTTWSTLADQSGDGVTAGGADDGYQASDLLFAPAVTATFGNAAVPLRFYHQTAKVVIKIKNAEYVTDAAQIRSVRIGDGNLALSGSYEVPTAAGTTAGVWTPGAADAEIAPRRLTTAPAGCVAAYEALVIPQSMDGERLVAVETAAGTMYYTPAAGDAQLGAGKVHTYIITVRADRLDVEVVRGGEWNDGGSEEVVSKELKAVYSATDLKFGDYFYSDGTWSDGGLRGIYADGLLKMTDEKPAPVEGKTVIGIVFQTDPARIGEAEKKALKAMGVTKPNGLVMALKNAGTNLTWGPDIDELLTNCMMIEQNYNDISGYGNCADIWGTHDNISDYPAFLAADDYNTTCPAPATTTGWYLPASGQWYDILRNLAGLADLNAAVDESRDYTWYGQGNVPAALNKWMEAIASAAKEDFPSSGSYWSSSEYFTMFARLWQIRYDGVVGCDFIYKGNDYAVRTVLAF